MKKGRLLVALAISASFFTVSGYAHGSDANIVLPVPSMTVIPVATILEKLKSVGYVKTISIELDGGMYNIIALDKEGEHNNLQVSAASGDIVQMQQMHPELDMLDIVNKVESIGYGNITAVYIPDGYFVVQCSDPSGNKVTLRVDAASGQIQK